MAYVYRHIRLDKNEPFYIGIGNDNNGSYKRAYSNDIRNTHWLNVVKKCKYEVEIMIDNIPYDFAKQKEKEFIGLYGRKDKKSGILCNKTDGGDGTLGIIVSKETRAKMSNYKKGKPSWNKGKKMSEQARLNNSLSKKGLLAGDKHPMYGTKMPIHVKEALRKANKGKPTWNKGKKFSQNELIQHRNKRKKQMKAVLKYCLDGVFIKKYESLGEAARELNCSKGTLSNACVKRGRVKTFRGFIWEYEGSR